MATVSIDFESRSAIDLREVGVYRYAEDETTSLWCMAWAVDEEEPQLWVPGQLFPERLGELIERGCELRAWNANFERVMWNYVCLEQYGFPEVPLEQWYCTAAEAAAMALPRGLDAAARITGVAQQKDDEGHRLMMRMARPRSMKNGKITWWEVSERRGRLYEYCKQDVRTERAIAKVVRRLTPQERKVYILDQKINDRGVLIDEDLARAALHLSEEATRRANVRIMEATGGAVDKVSKVTNLIAWLRGEGFDINSVRKSVVTELLEQDLEPHVRDALEARQDAGRSSVAKIDKMLAARCADGRVRGLLFYHGAGTGRWAGRLIQIHNFPRGDVKAPEEFIPYILAEDYDLIDVFYTPLRMISANLRGLIHAAHGAQFYAGDFKQIEARVLAWLAGQDDLVAAFAAGAPVYEDMAVIISDRSGFAAERQLGKATILGAGFQMGGDKFRQMAWEIYGVRLPEIEYNDEGEVTYDFAKDVVRIYRDKHDMIVKLWWELQAAALRAVEEPGSVHSYRGCKFTHRGAYLYLILPSGRPLVYASPEIRERRVPWSETETRPAVITWGEDSMTKQWRRRAMYGGLWTENIVQALARDILAEAMLRVDAAGYDVLFTVHDEIVSEREGGSLEEFEKLMSVCPQWAAGCPVDVDIWSGKRYKKA